MSNPTNPPATSPPLLTLAQLRAWDEALVSEFQEDLLQCPNLRSAIVILDTVSDDTSARVELPPRVIVRRRSSSSTLAALIRQLLTVLQSLQEEYLQSLRNEQLTLQRQTDQQHHDYEQVANDHQQLRKAAAHLAQDIAFRLHQDSDDTVLSWFRANLNTGLYQEILQWLQDYQRQASPAAPEEPAQPDAS